MTDKILIHVRFNSNGTVQEIAERPASMTPDQWFARLTEKVGAAFSALTGGRGVFKLSSNEITALKTGALQ